MNFTVSRLRNGDRVVALGALALLLVTFFFKWFGVHVPALFSAFVAANGTSTSANAWHSLDVIRWLLVLTILAAVVLVALVGTGRRSQASLAALMVFGLGLLSTALVLYRVAISNPFAHAEVKLGAWLGLGACALIAYGGYLAMSDEEASMADLLERTRSGNVESSP